MLRFIIGCSLVCLAFTAANAQDMPLSQVLIPGEEWQLVGEGYGFVDGLTADAAGNVYFSDLGKGKFTESMSAASRRSL